MSTAALDMAASSRWADLPSDLLRDISRRLLAATDYVRFHAVCKPWLDTLPPAPCRPAFLPWFLAPRDASGQRKARCVFFLKLSRRGATGTEMCVRDRRWVISADDGTAVLLLAPCPGSRGLLFDPLTGSTDATPLLPYPDEFKPWVKHEAGVLSGDGTIFLYAFGLVYPWSYDLPILATLLHPGDAAWTFIKRTDLSVYIRSMYNSSVSYHDGKIVKCIGNSWTIVSPHAHEDWHGYIPDEPGKKYQYGYIVKSHGDLLWAIVQVEPKNTLYSEFWAGDIDSLTSSLSVSVYTLQEDSGGAPQWVKRDGRSLADRVLFLGRPCSFAVHATRLGMSSGCAYFVDRRQLLGSKSEPERCRVFKYSFHDDKSKLVEQLPEHWKDDTCLWLTPQPSIAPAKELGERIEALNRKSSRASLTIRNLF